MENQTVIDISTQDRQLFADEGYMILKGVIPEDLLQMLREECSYFLGYMDAALRCQHGFGPGFVPPGQPILRQ